MAASLVLASFLAGGASLLAYRAHLLSPSGAMTSAVLGATVLSAGGWGWALYLILFFTSSSALSLLARRAPTGQVQKGGPRDARQVLANGGVAGLAALLSHTPFPLDTRLLFTASLASAAADTWSTEIGRLVGTAPRLITTGSPVPPGTSGGVSLAGTTAAALGALVMALAAPPLTSLPIPQLPLLCASGLAGALLDSFLGATVQELRVCSLCGEETERSIHLCGSPTRHARGVPGLDNDAVNALSTLAAGLAAALFSSL